MFKGFSDSSRNKEFHGFPNLNFQMNNEAYGFSGVLWNFDAAQSGLPTRTDLGALSYIQELVTGTRFIQNTAGNQPRYKSSDVNFNNEPTIDFFDAARFFNAQFGSLPMSNDYTYVCCGKVNTVNLNVIVGTSAAQNRGFVLASASLGVSPFGAGWLDGNTTGWMTGVNNTNEKIVIMTKDYIIVDGVSETTYGTAKTFNSLGNGFNQLGSSRSGILPFNGQLANVLAYNRVFSIDDATELCNRINQRYAIY